MIDRTTRTLADCTISERLLYSSFLLLVGIGYLMALGYLYLTHAGLNGQPGISVEDIAISYYGNRSGTRMEQMLRGPMGAYSKPLETALIVAWLQDGAPRQGYKAVARPILKEECFRCHSGAMAKSLNIPDFSTYRGVAPVTKVSRGASLLTLVKLSHIHLFGIGLLAFGVGLIFRLAILNRWLKWGLIVLPFLSVFADILAWFLTKWDPLYAWVVVIAGAGLGFALVAQILISLFELWFLGWPAED